MVITMELKNVIKRGETYHFRMPVPKNCIQKIGKSEIVQSLKTADSAEAAVAARKLRVFWINEFKSARTRVLPDLPTPVAVLDIKALT
jgi:hypothetical protein